MVQSPAECIHCIGNPVSFVHQCPSVCVDNIHAFAYLCMDMTISRLTAARFLCASGQTERAEGGSACCQQMSAETPVLPGGTLQKRGLQGSKQESSGWLSFWLSPEGRETAGPGGRADNRKVLGQTVF